MIIMWQYRVIYYIYNKCAIKSKIHHAPYTIHGTLYTLHHAINATAYSLGKIEHTPLMKEWSAHTHTHTHNTPVRTHP